MADFLGGGYLPPVPFNISHGLQTGCSVCSQKDNLSRCSGCKVVFYCNRTHQVSDRPSHKAFCNKIKKDRADLEKEEAKLRNHPGDWMTPAGNLLESEDAVGHFWGIHETRDYMRARFALVEALLLINTRAAVESALDHLLDMMRLCRGDNMGLRDLIPALYLRLGRDQECYDFCKWYAWVDDKSDYDWGDMSLGFLDIKDADVFEPVDEFCGKFASLSHAVAVTLIKIRLLVDLQTLERARREAGPKVPKEILDKISEEAVSSVIAGNREILDRDQGPHIKKLEGQVRQIFKAVDEANKFFWPALLKPGNNLTARPAYTSFGDKSEMQLKLQYWYNAWVETPGAIGVIEELVGRKG